MIREPIYSALFALITQAPGLKTSSRRLIPWEELAPADQPALMMIQKGEHAEVKTKLPTIWTLKVDIVLYAFNSGQTIGSGATTPMTALNPIVDAIATVLLPTPPTDDQTLGGLVTRCRIDGEIITDEGVLGNQAVVLIPITILVPQ